MEIFLSYRRSDSSAATDQLRDWLVSLVGKQKVHAFMDVYDVPDATDWRREIDNTIRSADVVIVVIGKNWLGQHLFATENAVKYEIELAQHYKKPLIPVLVEDAQMPLSTQLPPSIAEIAYINAEKIRVGQDRDRDRERLRRTIERETHMRLEAKNLSERERLYNDLFQRVRDQIQDGKRVALKTLAFIELGLSERPGAINPPYRRINPEDPEQQFELEEGTTLTDLLDAHRTLLILGKPGGGKTTLLLELGDNLIRQARDVHNAPLPIYLNLSTWSLYKKPLREWIELRLRRDYNFTKGEAKQILETLPLAFLLDGLDEVARNERSPCIKAINEFIKDQRFTVPCVVCCREEAYFSQDERLFGYNAIQVQDLHIDQIKVYLEQAGQRFGGLRTALDRDRELRELAQIPLWLNIMAVVYRDIPFEEFPSGIKEDDLRKRILEHYVETRLNIKWRSEEKRRSDVNKGILPQNQKQEIHINKWTKRLAWLAKTMDDNYNRIFYLESIQPSASKIGWVVNLLASIVAVPYLIISLGFFSGGIGYLAFGQIGEYIGLLGGAILGLVIAIIDGFGKIEVKDRLEISLSKILENSFASAFVGLVLALGIAYIRHGFYTNWYFLPLEWGIGGMLLGFRSKSSLESSNYREPNMGIKRTGLIGLLYGITFGLFTGIIGEIIAGPFVATLVGLIIGFGYGYLYGIGDYFKHWLTRLALWLQGAMPLRCSKFLKAADDRILLHQIGNGFEFIHPLLQEYFANLYKK